MIHYAWSTLSHWQHHTRPLRLSGECYVHNMITNHERQGQMVWLSWHKYSLSSRTFKAITNNITSHYRPQRPIGNYRYHYSSHYTQSDIIKPGYYTLSFRGYLGLVCIYIRLQKRSRMSCRPCFCKYSRFGEFWGTINVHVFLSEYRYVNNNTNNLAYNLR